ncbi:MAG TPA: MerR family transcriptional regulator [Chloroflexi bacterium]|nr:MerR family transcriptional regulator [Chloroflexota bacterium]
MTASEQPLSDKPIYNIGAVKRITEIPVATLRAWERRYGFPDAARTSGGHRLYTEGQIVRLQWVKARIDEGMQTRQAIEALREMEREGRFPEAPPPLVDDGVSAPDPSLEHFKTRLVAALLAGDLQGADQSLGEVLALYPLEALIPGLIRPVFTAIGEAWFAGEINVAQEHLATQFLHHRLVMWLMTGPPPRDVAPVVLACAPQEWHEGSLLMLGVLLRRKRWPVAYLGQAVPLPDLARYVRATQPLAVILVAMTATAAESLLAWPQWLPEAAAHARPIVAYGGHIFTAEPEWQARVPGIFLGPTLETGLLNLERLLQQAAPLKR